MEGGRKDSGWQVRLRCLHVQIQIPGILAFELADALRREEVLLTHWQFTSNEFEKHFLKADFTQ